MEIRSEANVVFRSLAHCIDRDICVYGTPVE